MQDVEHIGSRFIFIVAMERSGSHFLGSILGKEPSITYLDEIFNETMAQWSPFHFSFFLKKHLHSEKKIDFNANSALCILNQFWHNLAQSIPEDQRILIDVKREQLRILDWPPTFLHQKPNLLKSILTMKCPVLRCVRRNLLDHYASVRYASTIGEWILRSEAERKSLPQPLHAHPDDFRRHIESCRISKALMDGWLAGQPQVTQLAYETMRDGARLSAKARAAIETAIAQPLAPQARAVTLKQAPPAQELFENIQELEAIWHDSVKSPQSLT